MSLIDEKTATPLDLVGPGYALKKLKEWRDEGPTEKNRGMAQFLISRMSSPEQLSTLVDLALEWKDSTVLRGILRKCSSGGRVPQPSSDMLIRAWGVFTFDGIKDMLVNFTLVISLAHAPLRLGITLRNQRDTKVALGLINDLQSHAAEQDQNAKMWLKQQITAVFSKIRSAPTIADVQMYVGVAKSEGLPFFSNKCVPMGGGKDELSA